MNSSAAGDGRYLPGPARAPGPRCTGPGIQIPEHPLLKHDSFMDEQNSSSGGQNTILIFIIGLQFYPPIEAQNAFDVTQDPACRSPAPAIRPRAAAPGPPGLSPRARAGRLTAVRAHTVYQVCSVRSQNHMPSSCTRTHARMHARSCKQIPCVTRPAGAIEV